MKRMVKALIVATVVVSLAAACAPAVEPTEEAVQEEEEQAPADVSEEKVLKMGVQGPFTGPNARVGEEIKGHVNMAFSAIDWTVGDYVIEPVWIDTESDPEKGVTAYKEAVLREDIQLGFYGYHSSVTVAIMDVAAQYQVPHFFNQNESSVIVEKYHSDDKYAYHSWKGKPSPNRLFIGFDQALLNDAVEDGLWNPDNNKTALICEDTDFGRSSCQAFREMAEANEWEVISEDFTPIDETEYYPLLNKLKADNPSLILMTISIPAPVTSCIKQIEEVGLESLVVAFGLGWTGDWYELTGDAGDYIIDLQPAYTSDEQKQWAQDFENEFGISPGPGIAVGYDYANFLIEILRGTYDEYGELNKEAIFNFARDQVSSGNLTYTDGLFHTELTWTPDTAPEMVVGRDAYLDPVIQYFDGEAVPIWPDEMAEDQLQIPPELQD